MGETLDVKLDRPCSRLSLAKDVEYNRIRFVLSLWKQRKVENVSSKATA